MSTGIVFDRAASRAFYDLIGPYEQHGLERPLMDLLDGSMASLPEKRVLEIGSGTGRRAHLMLSMGLQVTAVDASRSMVQRTKESCGPGLEVLHLDAVRMPFEDNEFDISTILLTLECVELPHKILLEAMRVTRQMMVIACLNPCSSLGIRVLSQRLLRMTPLKGLRLYTPWSLLSLLRASLGAQRVRYVNPCFHPFPGIYIYVVQLYYDKIVQVNPIIKGRMKARITEGLAVTYRRNGGRHETGISL